MTECFLRNRIKTTTKYDTEGKYRISYDRFMYWIRKRSNNRTTAFDWATGSVTEICV
jgi:hypothetical protein